ncbi:Fic family protein [Streptomyces shenzhenensis]|uniref:Fic family protein n=1 Tax=Streptomyces shenzhenensis TaxID=943815 RepID=UPI0027E40FAD|nr:Fic family protein [Streptomyces shenzhenensis]
MDASHRHPLTCTLLTGWQQLVLGMPEVQFRQGDAFAKGSRERYALTSHTERTFEQCLRESADRRIPLASRAARAYLDVIFFHPFPDGNARLAMLTLAYVLESEGVRLDQVGPCRPRAMRATPSGRQTWLPWFSSSSARPANGPPGSANDGQPSPGFS